MGRSGADDGEKRALKKLDFLNDFSKMLIKFFECSLFAIIVTTPPHFLWIFIWDKTMLENISKDGFSNFPLPSIIATLVSSQDVSMARIFILFAKGN